MTEIAESRIADAEVVERQPDPGVGKALKGLAVQWPVFEQHALGHLEGQRRRREAGFAQDVRDDLDEIGLLDLLRREIDRHLHRASELALPFGHLSAGAPQDLLTEGDYLAAALGDRNELRRADASEPLVRPARQDLGAGDGAGVQVDDRLVGDVEFVVAQGIGQRVAQLEAPRRALSVPAVAQPHGAGGALGVAH